MNEAGRQQSNTAHDEQNGEVNTAQLRNFDLVTLTPRQFELEVKHHVEGLGAKLLNFEAKHDQILVAPDGDYQIDVYVTFEALGGTFRILIECKHYKDPVKRAVVAELYDKLRAVGAQKGMIWATGGYQSGAIRFAQQHGITLVEIVDGREIYAVKSMGGEVQLPPWGRPYEAVMVSWRETGSDTLGLEETTLITQEARAEAFGLLQASKPPPE